MNTREKKRKREISLFTNFLNFAGFLAKRPKLILLSNFILRRFADLTASTRKGSRQKSAAELGKEWQRMFPSKAFVPIKEISDDTVYAEIHGVCPVTGGGDVHACYRLMEYDHRMLVHIGGQLVVLESKADPAVSVCRVAIRSAGVPVNDLVQVHEKR